MSQASLAAGTTWLARCLSFAPGFTYYREPDVFDRVPEAEPRFANLYLTAERDDPAYRRLMTRACAGRLTTAITVMEDPANRRTARRVRETNSEGDDATYSVRRSTSIHLDRWKDRVTPEEIDQCRRFVEPFDLPYYPDFEPYVESFSGRSSTTPPG